MLLAKKKVIDQLTIPINQGEMALKTHFFPIHGKYRFYFECCTKKDEMSIQVFLSLTDMYYLSCFDFCFCRGKLWP